MGYLRTYRYLIQHESDFNITQQDNLRLIPKDVDWVSFCQFISELDHIEDSDVSGRYCYGELRLTRLNFYAPLFLRKFHFEQAHGQYGDFFGRLYGPILFVFAVISIILNSMQVELAVEQLVAAHWVSMWSVSRWFSTLSLMGAAVISVWFILVWLWMFLDEWIYTVRRRLEKRLESRDQSKC
jgi:ABC-type sugar transport system permease subunit